MSYTLYYWPLPFRGHPIRFVLAQAGATWKEADFDTIRALKDPDPADQVYPFMAPPLLHDHATGTYLSQLPAIVMALGRTHGLSHDPDLELRLVCDASDILQEITCHHGAAMWNRDTWAAFRDARLPRWMAIHDRLVRDKGLGSGEIGIAQLTLSALWHTMVDRLAPLRPLLHDTAPALEALADRVADLPAIATLRADWADSPARYCGGQIEASLFDMLEKDQET